MEDQQQALKEADELACKLINQMETDLPTALMVTAIMFGRLRYDALVQGAELEFVDDLFTKHATAITDMMEEEDGR